MDSLVHLLNQKIPGLKTLHSFWPFKKMAHIAYLFVSYNRRVIIPAKCTDSCGNPGTNWPYRIALILMAALIATLISLQFGTAVDTLLLKHNFNAFGPAVLLLVGLGWILQSLFALRMPSVIRASYWGHLAVTMTLGVLVLLPFIWLSSVSPWFLVLGVTCSSAFMLWQHSIRIKAMEITQKWTWTWFFTLQLTALIVFIILQFEHL